jgi:hypothetical protein
MCCIRVVCVCVWMGSVCVRVCVYVCMCGLKIQRCGIVLLSVEAFFWLFDAFLALKYECDVAVEC